jgi:Na+-driven multidrug efflux pump
LSIKNISFNIRDYGAVCVIGLPSLLRQGLASIATILLNGAANQYGGDAGTAAMGVVAKITQIIFMIMLGIGQGYQPVVGYNYGAHKYERVKQSFWFMLFMSSIVMFVGSLILALLADPLIKIFVTTPSGIKIGKYALYYQCIGLIFCPLGVACNMSFQSLGKKFRAIIVSCFRQGLFYIPFIIILPIYMKITGVEISMMIADILTFIVCIPFAISFFKEINSKISADVNQAQI